jgi:trehalose 6-phosphate synthase
LSDSTTLIVVSNRGPVTYDNVDGRRVARRGGGGLVTALRGVREQRHMIWIAGATTEEDRVVAREAKLGEDVLVAHEPQAYDRYYNVVANPMLWFIQHGLWGRTYEPELGRAFHDAWREGYERVNRTFADAVLRALDEHPGATVFFHDYHLYLAPAFVRAARPQARLAHFVHIPWPTDWSVLPEPMRRAVHEGLLANDVVAFHTKGWAQNFVRSCEDVVGGTRGTKVAHHPLSVDVDEFDRLQASDAVLAAEKTLPRPEKLVVRVDRTDPSKNIVRGFHAFALLLEEHPEWRGRVTMLALLDPSRQAIPQYVAYVAEIERVMREVNDRFGPVIEVQVADDFPRSVAAYKRYDVLLVNAVSDGLNLVAKEGPLVNQRDGVLVLSENAGAHAELAEWALGVSPFDVWGQACALHEALTMEPSERRRRADGLRAQVREHDLSRWLAGLLADLELPAT